MKLIISEKGDLAKHVAMAIGATSFDKAKGCYVGNGYYVVASKGHLFEMYKPDQIDIKYKRWDLNDLPIIPQNIGKFLKADCTAIYKKIEKLINDKDVDVIYNNGDSDAEGQCLIQEILDAAHNTKPVLRIWNSSMDANDIRKAVKDAQPDINYKNLLNSAKSRAELDWLYGMNLSRLMSIKGNAALPVGRVQTPVLALICKRAGEVENFKSIPYFEIAATDKKIPLTLMYNDENDKQKIFPTLKEAQKICDTMQGKQGILTKVVRTREKIKKPMIYCTSDIETDANQIFHIAPSDTLKTLEALYMATITTYPRTDCCYLHENMKNEFSGYLNQIAAKYPAVQKYVSAIETKGVDNDYIYNDKKVDEHTGIILSTGFKNCNIQELPDIQQKILMLIIRRMLTVCSPNPLYDKLVINAKVDDNNFSATETSAVSQGYLIFDKIFLGKQAKAIKKLPELKQGSPFVIDLAEPVQKIPKKPNYYTPGEMIKTMQDISRIVPDQYKQTLKNCQGLGTGATRDSIISNLLKPHGSGEPMCNLEKNKLIPTITGRYLISNVLDEVKSPIMTAQMEYSLDQIRKGQLTTNAFMAATKKHLIDIIATGKTANITPINNTKNRKAIVIGKCPRCGKNVIEYNKVYSCEGHKNKTCDFAFYKAPLLFTTQKKAFTISMAKKLLSTGKIHVVGFTSKKTGKKYDADVELVDPGNGFAQFKLSFPPRAAPHSTGTKSKNGYHKKN